MDKGNKIAYAIFKEVSRFSFYEWLKEWEFDGCVHSVCKHCGKEIMRDSHGNWF